MIKVPVDCEIPDGYIPVRFGAPKSLEDYLSPNGEVKTAYYDLHYSHLILRKVGNVRSQPVGIEPFYQKDCPGILREISGVEEAGELGRAAAANTINLMR